MCKRDCMCVRNVKPILYCEAIILFVKSLNLSLTFASDSHIKSKIGGGGGMNPPFKNKERH